MYVYFSYLCFLCSWCVSVLFLALVVCAPPLCVSFLFSCVGFLVSRISLLVLCFLPWWVSLSGVFVLMCVLSVLRVCVSCIVSLCWCSVSVVGGVCICLMDVPLSLLMFLCV